MKYKVATVKNLLHCSSSSEKRFSCILFHRCAKWSHSRTCVVSRETEDSKPSMIQTKIWKRLQSPLSQKRVYTISNLQLKNRYNYAPKYGFESIINCDSCGANLWATPFILVVLRKTKKKKSWEGKITPFGGKSKQIEPENSKSFSHWKLAHTPGGQERIQDFGQGGQAEFWPQGGGPWTKNVLKIGSFPLKISWKLHDFEETFGGQGEPGPQGQPPPWICYGGNNVSQEKSCWIRRVFDSNYIYSGHERTQGALGAWAPLPTRFFQKQVQGPPLGSFFRWTPHQNPGSAPAGPLQQFTLRWAKQSRFRFELRWASVQQLTWGGQCNENLRPAPGPASVAWGDATAAWILINISERFRFIQWSVCSLEALETILLFGGVNIYIPHEFVLQGLNLSSPVVLIAWVIVFVEWSFDELQFTTNDHWTVLMINISERFRFIQWSVCSLEALETYVVGDVLTGKNELT